MKKAVAVVVLGVILALGSATAQAASIPISGSVSGIELCPQFICGVAVFAMGYQGRIGPFQNASGIITTALNHGPLPTPTTSPTTPIYRGKWELQSLFVHIKGDVVSGLITIEDTDSKKFHITAELSVIPGGNPALQFDGTLDHNPTIPTIKGTILPLH